MPARGALAAVACAALLWCCQAPDDQARYSAQNSVAEHLKDPDSAKFGPSFIVRERGQLKNGLETSAVCGIVNAKNSFGAYAGGSRYVVLQMRGQQTLDTIYVWVEDSDRHPFVSSKATLFEVSAWNKHCVDAEHRATYSASE